MHGGKQAADPVTGQPRPNKPANLPAPPPRHALGSRGEGKPAQKVGSNVSKGLLLHCRALNASYPPLSGMLRPLINAIGSPNGVSCRCATDCRAVLIAAPPYRLAPVGPGCRSCHWLLHLSLCRIRLDVGRQPPGVAAPPGCVSQTGSFPEATARLGVLTHPPASLSAAQLPRIADLALSSSCHPPPTPITTCHPAAAHQATEEGHHSSVFLFLSSVSGFPASC